LEQAESEITYEASRAHPGVGCLRCNTEQLRAWDLQEVYALLRIATSVDLTSKGSGFPASAGKAMW